MGLAGAKRAATVASISAVVLVAGYPATATATPPKAFSYSGHCTELQLGVPADPVELGKLVPTGFAPLGSPLAPTVTVGVPDCSATTADDEPVAPWTGSLVGTPLVPRAGGFERYWLWHLSDSGSLNAGFERMGLRTGLVADTTLELGEGGPGFIPAHADVPWQRGRYSLDARVSDTPGAPLVGTSAFWHRGRHGLVKITYEIIAGRFRTAIGQVSAEPGSPLARLIGPQSAGPGLLIEFHFRGTTEFVE